MNKELTILLAPNQKTVALLQNISKIGGVVVIILGLFTLLTYNLHVSISAQFFPNVVGMNPIVSLGFICSAGALLVQLPHYADKKPYWQATLALILSSLTLILGTVTTVYLLVQHTLFTNKGITLDVSLSFLFTGIALLLFPIPAGKHYMRAAHGFSILTALLSMFAILGYLYSSLSFYSILPVAPMPLSTALTFTILSVSLIFARPNRGFIKVLTRSTPSSILAFRLIMLTLIVPAVLGFIILQGEQLHLYDASTGLTLFVIGSISLLSVAVWVNGSVLQKLELENLIIKNELEKKNVTLEIDEKKQASKILELEEEKQEVYDKLSNREKLMDLPANEL